MSSYTLAALQGFGSYDDAALEGFGSYDDAALEGFGSYDDAALEGFGSYDDAALEGFGKKKAKHFVKGSPEAKAFMAKLRAMRGKGVRKARGGKIPSADEIAKIANRLKEIRENKRPGYVRPRRIPKIDIPELEDWPRKPRDLVVQRKIKNGYPNRIRGYPYPLRRFDREPDLEMEGGSLLEGLLLKAPYKVIKGAAKGIKYLIDKKKK